MEALDTVWMISLFAAGAVSRAAFHASDQLVDTCQADEYVHDGFYHRHCAQEQIDDIPVCTISYQTAEADQAPVEGSDDDKNTCDGTDRVLGTGHGNVGKGILEASLLFLFTLGKQIVCTECVNMSLLSMWCFACLLFLVGDG